jgi:DNA-binding ferritin-like protein
MIDPMMARELLKAQNDLVIASRVAHWNVRGPNFYESHLLFERIYGSASESVDTLVEVLRGLGYSPTFEEFTGPGGSLPSYDAMSLVEMLTGYVTTYMAALLRIRDAVKEEKMAVGLVNLLEQLCEDATGVLYLLSAAQGR